MILHEESFDYKRHNTYVYGEYVQAHDEPANPTKTNAARSLANGQSTRRPRMASPANKQGGQASQTYQDSYYGRLPLSNKSTRLRGRDASRFINY